MNWTHISEPSWSRGAQREFKLLVSIFQNFIVFKTTVEEKKNLKFFAARSSFCFTNAYFNDTFEMIDHEKLDNLFFSSDTFLDNAGLMCIIHLFVIMF